jgi:hypothetical protein
MTGYNFPYIITSEGVTVYVDGEPMTVLIENKYYPDVIENIKDRNWDEVRWFVNQAKSVQEFIAEGSDGDTYLKDGVVYYMGEPTHSVITDRIIDMYHEGFNVTPMLNFLSNLMLNPSRTAVQELYLFLESGHLPITDDGCFLAYKNVREDYYDKHSGTVRYKIGDTPTMDRNKVDDQRDNVCSHGLHFCSIDYLNKMWGHSGRTMVVKINPADVVSIPSDYGNTKGRTWRMEVVAEIDSSKGEFTKKPVYNPEQFYEQDNDDFDYEQDDYPDGYVDPDCTW